MSQSTDRILMVRPATFRSNEQTTANNYFQQVKAVDANTDLLAEAQREFDALVQLLRSHGVQVGVVQDNDRYDTPDALFPNNHVSFHKGGTQVSYSMYAPNRRQERELPLTDVLQTLGVAMGEKHSLAFFEKANIYLEGTGSLVLDRANGIAYASLSGRTHREALLHWCQLMGFKPMMFRSFHSVQSVRQPIYHTNVMMCVGSHFAVLCAMCIDNEAERHSVVDELEDTGHHIIYINEEQMGRFAGNMLELKNSHGETLIVMSQSAHDILTADQLNRLSSFGKLIAADLHIIEEHGGGSARCMIAEVFV
ncbi:MAG: citrulline utilization hydrolase CtlX [Flavobacteriales bacterium]